MPFLKNKGKESTPMTQSNNKKSRSRMFARRKSGDKKVDVTEPTDKSPLASLFRKQQHQHAVEEGREESETTSSFVQKMFTKHHNRASSSADRSSDDTQSHSQAKVVYHDFGQEPEALLTVEREEEIPHVLESSSTDVIIKVQASTVTVNDCLLRRGFDFNIFSPHSLPLTPGGDVVGTIIEVGGGGGGGTDADAETDTRFAVGDRVAALVRSGGNARYVRVPQHHLVKVPSSLDAGEVAALVSIYTTAYQALRSISSNHPMFSLEGKNVLILGGLDGVGQALMQLCKKAKATVYVVAPTKRHSYLRSFLGVLPLNGDSWLPTVKGEIDYVFDGICENGSEEPLMALKEGGELVSYAQAAMFREESIGMFGVPLHAHMNKIHGMLTSTHHSIDIWESFKDDPERYKNDLKNLMQWLKWKKIVPHVAKRVSLAQVGAAQAMLEEGDVRGTIICFPGKSLPSSKSERE